MKSINYRSIPTVLLSLLLLLFTAAAQEYDWASIDEESFESFQPTDKIMDVIGIQKGMYVGEVGAGGGRVIVRVARRVGPTGRVYANDITASALKYMQKRIKREKIKNMEVIEGTLTDPCFPEAVLDVVFLTNTYRHLDKPINVLKNIIPSLKPEGRLGIVDSKRYAGSKEKNEIIRNTEAAGFKLIKTDRSMPRDDIYVFEIRPEANELGSTFF